MICTRTHLESSHCCAFGLICFRSINLLCSINQSFGIKLRLVSRFIVTACLSISLHSSLSPNKFNKGRTIITIIIVVIVLGLVFLL